MGDTYSDMSQDPTRCFIINNTVYVREQLRLAGSYFEKGEGFAALTLIEDLLRKGDIAF